MKDWEKYEEQIFEKLKREFPDSDIKKNQKIKGIFSKRSRQVDILVTANSIGKQLKVVIDCKKFSKKINVKTVESFIGFLEDVGANLGILITNIGYTKSAYNRIENYVRDIRLDIVEFSKLEDYYFNWYTCEACYNSEKPRISEVYWSEPNLLEFNGLFQLIEIGKCDYCGTPHIRCQGCGMVIEIDELEFTNCMCGLSFAVEPNKSGDDPSDVQVVIKEVEENYTEENFVDPNQLDLFDQK